MKSILDTIRPVHAGNATFVPKGEDIFENNPATDVINLENAQGCLFAIYTGNNAGSGAATITIEACDNVTPSNTTAIAFKYQTISADVQGSVTWATSSGLAAVGAANTVYLFEVDAATVAKASVNGATGNKFVRLKATETQSDAVDGAITAMLIGLRYQPLSATQLA